MSENDEFVKLKITAIQKILDVLRKALQMQTMANKFANEAMVRRVAMKYAIDGEDLVATIWAESNMDDRAINKNANGTTDYGLCQFNDYWYKNAISPEDALNDPEKAVNVMAQAWQSGRANDWIAFRNKTYLKYL